MYEYSREVFYYETDKMGVVHHSNFPRWFEEARTRFYADIGLPYEETEANGVICPVTEMNMRFRHFARFGDRFTVRLKLTKYTGVRFSMEYVVTNQNGDILLEGSSAHAFLNASYNPVSLSKALPHKHETMKKYVEAE